MRALRVILALLLVTGLGAWIGWVHRLADEPLGIPGVEAAPDRAPIEGGPELPPGDLKEPQSNADCEPCHREIYEEWIEDQHALAWFNTPFLPQDPKLVECNNCHAPQPVLQTGIEKLPLIRTERFEEGVGCIECHWNIDHVEGPRPSGTAACNPVYNPRFTESVICASCHAAHGSIEEWRGSEWARKGYSCQACHMPLVDAPVVTGGLPRRRRSHRMRTQRDLEHLRSAVTLEARWLDDGRLEVSLANTGAGHNVPGEISNREMFLLTVIEDADGEKVAEHRESFKTVKRTQRSSLPSTQLRPGEKRVFVYARAAPRGKAVVSVGYKYLEFIPDDRSVLVEEKVLEF